MTLLTPMSALFAGLIAFPILLTFYMLKLRRRPLTVSATFLWEQAAHDVQGNVPLRWIKPTLLFLLHALILALFVLALGRPAIERQGPSSARAFFLFDISASMAATDAGDGNTRLDEAKEQALKLGRNLLGAPGRPEITVLSFAQDARIVSRPLDSVRELRAVLDEIHALDQPGRLEPALRLTESLIRAPADESVATTEPLVAVFSDGVFTDRTPLALSGARVTLAAVETKAAQDQGNVAIVACSAARNENSPASALLFVRLESTFTKDQPVTVAVIVDGELTRSYPVVIPAAGDAGPGSIGKSFAIQVPGSAVVTAAVATKDLLETDNSASVYLPSPKRPRVLLVHPDDLPPNLFLKDVLEEIQLRSLRVMTATDYAQFAAERVAGAVDLVVFDQVAPQVLPQVPTLSFGAWAGNIDLQPNSGGPGGFILSWDRANPVLAHVTLDAVQIARLEPAPVPESLADIGRVHELASARAGSVITLVETSGGPRGFVRFALDQSNWPLHFSFPIFMLNAVETLTGSAASRASVAFTTIEPVIARLDRPMSTVRLVGPETITIDRGNDASGLVSLGVIPRAGVYRADGVEPRAIAVNMFSSIESGLGVRDQLVVGGVDAPRLDAAVGRREIWHWFIMAAAALLILEWFVYAARVRV
jgi:von Willebrand factor type A domain/Aerotolerance regulator N-terminal